MASRGSPSEHRLAGPLALALAMHLALIVLPARVPVEAVGSPVRISDPLIIRDESARDEGSLVELEAHPIPQDLGVLPEARPRLHRPDPATPALVRTGSPAPAHTAVPALVPTGAPVLVGSGTPAPGASESGDGGSALGASLGSGAAGGSAGSPGAARTASQGPRLVGPGASCSDLFPHSAREGRADVRVQLAVAADGQARFVRTLSVTGGQDFDLAARACSSRLRFSPAKDESGRAIEARAVVELHFVRAS